MTEEEAVKKEEQELPTPSASEEQKPVSEAAEEPSKEESSPAEEGVKPPAETDVEGESRAAQRIRRLVTRNKELEAQLQPKEPQAPETPSDSEFMSQSELQQMTRVEAERIYEMRMAEREHPELVTDDALAAAVIYSWQQNKEGKSMSEIASEVKTRWSTKATEEGEKKALINTADRMNAAVGRAGTSKSSVKGKITRDAIGEMSNEEYAKRLPEINEALAKGEIE